MRHARVAVLALFAVAACRRDIDLPPRISPDAFISGRVLESDAQGAAPLSGVAVTVGVSNVGASSDDQGAFAVGPVPEGTYRVLLSRRDPASGVLSERLFAGVAARRGATVSLGDVALRASAVITGRVLLEGRARGNAGVLVFAPGLGTPATTLDDGSYLLRGLPEGELQVQAFRSGYLPASTGAMAVRGGQLNDALDLVLPAAPKDAPPGAIAGSVLVTDAADSSGVQVSAYRAGAADAAASAVTGADGSFSLPGLATDLWRVRLSLAGYAPADVTNIAVAPGLTTPVERVVLSPPGPANTGADAGSPPPPPPPDAGSPDAGPPPDGGTIGAQCNVDTDCASGRLCVQGLCVGCSSDVGCRSGYSCRAGDCVRSCAADSDCITGQICNPSTGLCGPCVTNADCHSAALICYPGGACGHCHSRADCPAGLACLTAGCGACAQDADCGGAGNLCQNGQCISGNCHTSAACDPLVCASFNCASCTSDAQCPAGRLCLPSSGGSACLAANCRANTDCPATSPVCLSNECGACTSDAQCGAGNICLGGLCAPGNCHDNSGCSGGQVCNAAHSCAPCTASAQCTSGSVCDHGACKIGNCVTSADCPSGAPICTANSCLPCAQDAQCAASNVICLGGQCAAGNCHDASGCSAGQYCNAQHFCAICSLNSQCGAGNVCDHGACKPGNCVFNSDCAAGKICSADFCASCGSTAQCPSGMVCAAPGPNGNCVTGNCVADSDCASNHCAANVCQPCDSSTLQGGCAAGNVCDHGTCKTGNCVAFTDCTGGKYCAANSCAACTASAQCPASYVCASGSCVVGNCVLDSDCASNHCVSHTCQPCSASSACAAGNVCDVNSHCTPGNCLQAADCTTSSVYNGQVCINYSCQSCTGAAALCPGTNGCVAGACAACTASSQCAAGKVCDGSGHCVAGNCSPLDVPCSGTTCVSFTCQQTTPMYGGEAATVPGGPNNQGSPSPVYGSSTVYAVPGQYPPVSQHLVAYDPATLAARYAPVAGNSYGTANIAASVVPARGFPGDELLVEPYFLFPGGGGLTQAFAGGNGAPYWSATQAQYGDIAVGIADGQVTIVWAIGSQLVALHPDGSNARLNNLLLPCTASRAPVFGTKMLYLNCSAELIGIDPAAGTLAVTWQKPHVQTDGTTAATLSTWSPLAVYRPSSATYDLVFFIGYPNSPVQTNLYALRVDDTAGSTPPTRVYTVAFSAGTVDYQGNGAIAGFVLDASGAAHVVSSTGGWAKVSLTPVPGTISSGTSGAGFDSPFIALESDGSVVGFSGGQLQAVALQDANAAPVVKWKITSPAGTLWNLTWPGISPTGLLHAWAEPGGPGAPFALTVYTPLPGVTLPAPPAWPVHGGNVANQNRAPAYDCTADSNCSSPAACVLGRCIGNCRSRADCTSGSSLLGCVAAVCSPCVADASCAAGEICSDGGCFACSGPACCHTNSDCGSSSKACLNTNCVGVPSFSSTTSWTRNDFPALSQSPAGAYYQISQGTDGTIYAIYKNSNSDVKLSALDPTTGLNLGGSWTSNPITLASGNFYTYLPPVLVTTLAGQSTDTIFSVSTYSAFPQIYAVTGGTTGGALVVKRTDYPAFSRLSTGLYCPTGQPLGTACTGGLRQALFYISSITSPGSIVALDAQAAATGPSCSTAGCLPVLWQGPMPGSCNLVTDLPPLVGSDGAVYVICASGQVWAFDPNGNSGVAKPLLNYPVGGSPPFYTYEAPLLYKGSTGDVLSYIGYDSVNGIDCPVSVSVGSNVVPAVVAASVSACVLHQNPGNLVADAAGYLYLNNGLFAVYPANLSARLGSLPNLTAGHSLELGQDGLLYAVRGTQISAVQLTPNHGLSVLWSIYGPGGFNYDSSSTPSLLPGPRLLSDAANTGAGTRLLGMVVPSTPSAAGLAAPPAWPTVGGDYKRRFSLCSKAVAAANPCSN